jgi:hypothetical protein
MYAVSLYLMIMIFDVVVVVVVGGGIVVVVVANFKRFAHLVVHLFHSTQATLEKSKMLTGI